MGKDSPQAPPPPDYAALTQGQAEANRIDVKSPYGSATYGGPSRRELTIDLSPEQQALLGGTQGIQGNMVSAGQSISGQLPTDRLNFEGLPGQVSQLDTSGLNPYFGQDAQSTQDLSNAVYESTATRLRPEFARQQETLSQDLANRGIPINSSAYTTASNRLMDQQNDAFAKAGLDATIAGSDLGFRARNQGLSELGMQANLQNQARSQGIGERQALRASPYNELAAIINASPVQSPQVVPPGQVDVTGPASLAYSGQMNAYNQNMANRQANLGGLYSLGAAAMPWAFM